MRSFEESSGGFSGVVATLPFASDASEGTVDGAVDEGEGSTGFGAVDAIVVDLLASKLR